MVDIITFCKDAKYLGLSIGFQLSRWQELTLKLMYYNEGKYSLTDDDKQFMQQSLLPKVYEQIINKLGNDFNKHLFIFGRRSGSSTLMEIVGLYEIYRNLISMCKVDERPKSIQGNKVIKQGLVCNNRSELNFKEIFDIRKPYVNNDVACMFCSQQMARNAGADKCRNMVYNSPYLSHYYAGSAYALDLSFVRKDNETNLINHYNDNGVMGRNIRFLAAESPNTYYNAEKILYIGYCELFKSIYDEWLDNPQALVIQVPTWLMNTAIPQDLYKTEKNKMTQCEFNKAYGALL